MRVCFKTIVLRAAKEPKNIENIENIFKNKNRILIFSMREWESIFFSSCHGDSEKHTKFGWWFLVAGPEDKVMLLKHIIAVNINSIDIFYVIR